MRLTFSVLLLVSSVTAVSAQNGDKSVKPITVPRKVALVIGNGTYKYITGVPPASQDADDVAAALRTLHFDVVDVRKDLTADQLIAEVGRFSRTRVQAGDLALVYYSGHGGQIGEENYLLPVDYDPPSDEDLVERRAYRMSKVRDAMERTGARVRIFIFDACRNSPVVTAKDSTPGLRPMEGKPEGTLIAFASAHNQVARYDTGERNSFYTAELLPRLRAGGELKGIFEQVQNRVYERTDHRQTPYLYGFLSAPLYLGEAKAPVYVTPSDAALEAWNAVKDSNRVDLLERFVDEFGSSPYAGTARIKIAVLSPAPAPGRSETVLRAGSTKVNPKDGLTYVWIPPGTFEMGCSPGDSKCAADEKPAHQVTITKGFWMGQVPVPQDAYLKLTGFNPSKDPDLTKYPKAAVNRIKWRQASDYCQSTGMALPSEAEWEYAARAGSTASHYAGWPNPNQWGLWFMLGYGWEWTGDWYSKYSSHGETDPHGPTSGKERTLRGTAWPALPSVEPDVLRVSARTTSAPEGPRDVRFRCAGQL